MKLGDDPFWLGRGTSGEHRVARVVGTSGIVIIAIGSVYVAIWVAVYGIALCLELLAWIVRSCF